MVAAGGGLGRGFQTLPSDDNNFSCINEDGWDAVADIAVKPYNDGAP